MAVYMTGLGAFGYPFFFQAGTVASQVGSVPTPLQVTVENLPAEVRYAGSAPGLLIGVYQVNVRIPPTTEQGLLPLGITVAGQMAQSQNSNGEVGIYVSCAPGSTCPLWWQQ